MLAPHHVFLTFQRNTNAAFIGKVEEIIENDKLFTFTARDLQLHSGLLQELSACVQTLADDVFVSSP